MSSLVSRSGGIGMKACTVPEEGLKREGWEKVGGGEGGVGAGADGLGGGSDEEGSKAWGRVFLTQKWKNCAI